MPKYSYDLKNKSVLETLRSPLIYQFNLARNMALLSNDPAVIRYFYTNEAPRLLKDQWLTMEITDKFLAQYIPGQAFSYFGICPMIVQGKVNLIASNGFKCQSEKKDIDEKLNRFIDEAGLEEKFAEGVYLESGLGDFLYRFSYDPKISDKPIIDVIEPQFFEVNYVKKQINNTVLELNKLTNSNNYDMFLQHDIDIQSPESYQEAVQSRIDTIDPVKMYEDFRNLDKFINDLKRGYK